MTPKQDAAVEEATAMAVYLGIDPVVAAKEVNGLAEQLAAFNRIPGPAPVVSPLWSDILHPPMAVPGRFKMIKG